MRHALPDGTTPDQTGHGLCMAHHYRVLGAKTKASSRAGGSLPPQAGLGKTQTTESLPGETIGLPKSRSNDLGKHTEGHVRSKGMPHVGHADSVTNDEHGSRSDVSD